VSMATVFDAGLNLQAETLLRQSNSAFQCLVMDYAIRNFVRLTIMPLSISFVYQ
jgi:hypothetical protein